MFIVLIMFLFCVSIVFTNILILERESHVKKPDLSEPTCCLTGKQFKQNSWFQVHNSVSISPRAQCQHSYHSLNVLIRLSIRLHSLLNPKIIPFIRQYIPHYFRLYFL
jgi:hypothetical protein